MTTGAVAKKCGRNYTMIERDEKYIHYGQIRLNNTIVEMGDIENAVLDIKPLHVTVKEMVDAGYFQIGEKFVHKNGKIALLASDSGELEYEGTIQSMHEVAGLMINSSRRQNGFDCFYVYRNGQLISINQVRNDYRNKIGENK